MLSRKRTLLVGLLPTILWAAACGPPTTSTDARTDARTETGTDSGPRPDMGVPIDMGGPVDTGPDPDMGVPPTDNGPPVDTGGMCGAPRMMCGANCVDTQTDAMNCGTCGTACPAGQTCQMGACAIECTGGLTRCGTGAMMACADTTSDNANCGMCGRACPTGQSCTAGACVCPTGQTLCGSACVDTSTNAMNCGTCGTACGAATPICMTGMCRLNCTGAGMMTCMVGGSPICANTTVDPANCGTCGNACAPGQTCGAGVCVCPAGQMLCGGRCVTTATDPANCGSCGNRCTVTGQTCTGSCNCPAGQMACGAACTNTTTDINNCGMCGRRCTITGQTCGAGVCACPAGQTACGTACTNLTNDNANCGICGRVCTGGQSCMAGVCAGGAPANNACAAAQAITFPVAGTQTTVSGTNVNATLDGTGLCGFNTGLDVWYTFVVPTRSFVYADTLGTTFDTVLSFHTACGTAPVVCNDDSCGTVQSQISNVFDPGTYRISVAGYNGNSGAFTLHLQALPVPAGTNSSGLVAMGASSLIGNTTGQPLNTVGCGGSATRWYHWLTCPASPAGNLVATTCARVPAVTFDTELQVRNGNGVATCNDDSCGFQSMVSGPVAAGAGIHILGISGFGTTNVGAYSIGVTRP